MRQAFSNKSTEDGSVELLRQVADEDFIFYSATQGLVMVVLGIGLVCAGVALWLVGRHMASSGQHHGAGQGALLVEHLLASQTDVRPVSPQVAPMRISWSGDLHAGGRASSLLCEPVATVRPDEAVTEEVQRVPSHSWMTDVPTMRAVLKGLTAL